MPRKGGETKGSQHMAPMVRNAFRLALKRQAGTRGTSTSALADFIEEGMTHKDWMVRIAMFRAVSHFCEKQVSVSGSVDVQHTVAVEGYESLRNTLLGVAQAARAALEGEVVDVPRLVHDAVVEEVERQEDDD